MKLILLLTSLLFAGDIICGGYVPVINTVAGYGMISVDLNKAAVEQPLMQLVINNNTEVWELTIETLNGGRFVSGNNVVQPTQLDAIDHGGTLGVGGIMLGRQSLLYEKSVVWKNHQTTATVDYIVDIIGSWDKTNAMAGLYTETVTAVIRAGL